MTSTVCAFYHRRTHMTVLWAEDTVLIERTALGNSRSSLTQGIAKRDYCGHTSMGTTDREAHYGDAKLNLRVNLKWI
jgi:hypothetical protein